MPKLQSLALALFRQMTGRPEVEWEDMNEGARGIAIGLATAALKEMRQLPERWYEDGGPLDSEIIGMDRAPEYYWEKLIDAALLDAPEGMQGRG